MKNIKDMAERTVFTVDGVEYAVRRPTIEELTKANEKRRRTFNEEMKAGTIFRDQLQEELKKRHLWSDERDAKYQTLAKEVVDCEYALAKGGITLSDAKAVALSMRKKRQEMTEMLSVQTELDSNTCEGRADAIRFNYLFACCLVYNNTNEPYFKNGLVEYLAKQDDPVASVATVKFFYLMSDTDDMDSRLVENQFLQKYKFADDKHRLIDDKGRLVDLEGRHINEEGRYIKWTSDTDYIKVDVEGRPLNDAGDFVVDHEPFLDDSGEPINEEEYTKSEEKPKKRRRRTTQ